MPASSSSEPFPLSVYFSSSVFVLQFFAFGPILLIAGEVRNLLIPRSIPGCNMSRRIGIH